MIAVRRPADMRPETPSSRVTPAVTRRSASKRTVTLGRSESGEGAALSASPPVVRSGDAIGESMPALLRLWTRPLPTGRDEASVRCRHRIAAASPASSRTEAARGAHTTSREASAGQAARERHLTGAELLCGQNEPAGHSCGRWGGLNT